MARIALSKTVRRRARSPSRRVTAVLEYPARTATRFPIAGIGASAGGLEAFSALLKFLPADTGIGFVLIQHLDPQHASELVALLQRGSVLPIQEVVNDVRVEPNHVYVIPPNSTMRIVDGVLKLAPREPPRGSARSIDEFFESLAADLHERAIGVVLSGTGTDGTAGLEAIKAEGGITLAQDDSARFDAMPRSAEAANCVDYVLSPESIAGELARIARHPAIAAPAASPEDDRAGQAVDPSPPRSDGRPGLEKSFQIILQLLRDHSGVDFTLYKSSTIRRRIIRRMVLARHHTLDSYAASLGGNAKELDALYSDALISVTSFFRNPDSFEVLEQQIWPAMLQRRDEGPVRVWVLGCSTGQEAYSIAMSFVEAGQGVPQPRRIQIFATDLNDALLDKARHGLYARNLVQDLSPERQQRFFVEEDAGYRVSKPIREMVVFARQNVIGDPPFSRLDVISCRNLLIYFEPDLQQQVLPMFHYALKPGGFLCLGASESVGPFTDLFHQIDKKQKIFTKTSTAVASRLPLLRRPGGHQARLLGPVPRLGPHAGEPGVPAEPSAQREADRVSVLRFAPSGVLIDDEMQVLQFRGVTSEYLEPASGRASFHVLKMARGGLMLPLRAAIASAKKTGQITITRGIKLTGERPRTVDIEVIPLRNLRQRCLLVLFQEPGKAAHSRKAPAPRRLPAGSQQRRISELEQDLAGTRDYLQSIQEEHDASSEELQSSNEEVQSSNEELQSLNEELQTSKEELESANEELETVNEEMVSRNAELVRVNAELLRTQHSASAARDYAESIIRTVRDPLLILDGDLLVQRANDAFYRTFKVTRGETEGRRLFELGNGQWEIPRLCTLVEEILPRNSFFNDFEVTTDFPIIGRRTMLLNARRLTNDDSQTVGVLVGIQDITEVLQYQASVRHTQARYQALVDASSQVIWAANADGEVVEDSPSWRAFTGQTAEQFKGMGGLDAVHPDDRERVATLWRTALRDRRPLLTEYRLRHVSGGWHWTEMRTVPVFGLDGKVREWVGTNTDISERREAVDALREAERHKNEFLGMLAHELRNPLAPIRNASEVIRLSLGGEQGDKAVATAVTIIERQVAHMARLVEDLLDLSRVSRGVINLRMDTVDLSALVREAVASSHSQFASKGQRVALRAPEGPILMNGDATRLVQAFGNLLHNASKFTGNDGDIHVTIEHDADHDSEAHALVTISDSGIGIAPEQLPRIFEMFKQVDPRFERTISGLGIGLTLVRTLMDLHDGTIEARSGGIGMGTQMIVRLPILRVRPTPG